MALKHYNPTTPSQRGLVLIDRSALYKGRPVKALTEGKTKRWKGTPYTKSDVKKAIVTLADGQTIDITEGVR